MMWDTPIEIGGIRVKNRIAFPPLSANWAAEDGSVTDRIVSFYSDIAKGGCGMVVVSGTAVTAEAKGSDRSLILSGEAHIPGFTRLAETIRQNRCLASIQLMHVGGQGNPGFTGSTPVSPSGVPCRATGFASRELSREEIRAVERAFVASALLAARAGFQAVEIHLAHGYLLHEFLSPRTNRRSDEYGGPLENRMRIVLGIIEGMQRECPGLVVGARVSGHDYLEGGLTPEENRAILPALVEAGLAYLSVTAGVYDSSAAKHEAMAAGRFFDYARDMKRYVPVPVMAAGKVLDLDSAERHLVGRDCDLVAIGRGLVADPSMIEKSARGEAFSRCIECGECQYLRYHRTEMSCPLWEKTYE